MTDPLTKRTARRHLIVGAMVCMSAIVPVGCGGSDDEDKEPRAREAPGSSQGDITVDDPSAPARGRVRPKNNKGPAAKDTGKSFGADAPPYVGQFVSRLTADEAADVGAPYGAAGRLNLTIGRAGYDVSSRKAAFGGSVKVSGDTMRFGPAAVPGKALRGSRPPGGTGAGKPCGKSVGTYTWTLEGKTLSFDLQSDDCTARRTLLSRDWEQTK